jgi:hypothetical protein
VKIWYIQRVMYANFKQVSASYKCLGGSKNLLTRSELSTGLPRPLPIPQPPRKIAAVMAQPIKIASVLSIWGNVVILQRKYADPDMVEPEKIRRIICDYSLVCMQRVRDRKGAPTIHVSPLS